MQIKERDFGRTVVRLFRLHHPALKVFILLVGTGLLVACQSEQGTLQFTANGEAFARQPFVSKDGWTITFSHVVVQLDQVTAYQSDSSVVIEDGDEPTGRSVSLKGRHSVDLAAGGQDAAPIVVGTVSAETGHYNAVSWQMQPDGDAATIMLSGSAEKHGQTVQFAIDIDNTFAYRCGEYIGDQRKGFVWADAVGTVELTFHLDHIFGNQAVSADDAINQQALGFQPLASLASDGRLAIGSDQLQQGLDSADYHRLQSGLASLGHVGEGHCFEAANRQSEWK